MNIPIRNSNLIVTLRTTVNSEHRTRNQNKKVKREHSLEAMKSSVSIPPTPKPKNK